MVGSMSDGVESGTSASPHAELLRDLHAKHAGMSPSVNKVVK